MRMFYKIQLSMKKTITVVIVFFFLLPCFSQSSGLSVINSAGGSSRSGYYQLEWSVGEMSLIGQMNNYDNTLVVTNGFLQPFLQYLGPGNLNNLFGNDEIKIFPNPA